MTLKFINPSFIGTRTYAAGETADLPPELAARLIADGSAMQAKPKPVPIETADDKTKPAEIADATDNDELPRGTMRVSRAK